MLIDLLQSAPGQGAHQFPPIDRLITGNYKSNGSLVSLKVDIIDCTDFQRVGCLVSPGTGGLTAPHSHNITGILFCQPDTNTVRLNINVLGPCSVNHEDGGLEPRAPKDVKPWVMTTNKMTSGTTELTLPKNMQYSPFTSPVSPPSQEAPPPLLDFHSDQLISEIHSMSFDYSCGGVSLNSQLLNENMNTTSSPSPNNSQSQANNSNSKDSKVSLLPLLQSQQSNNVITNINNQPNKSMVELVHPTLLQPKIERSDSLCSEYSAKEEIFYASDLGNLDDIDDNNQFNSSQSSPLTSLSSPLTSLSSPLASLSSPLTSISSSPIHSLSSSLIHPSSLLFPPTSTILGQETQASYFTKSFNSKPLDKIVLTPSTPSTPSSAQWAASSSNNTFGPSLAARSPKMAVAGGSPSSSAASEPNGSPQQFVLGASSPKARNRRNSSFDETKPHVCPQCGARFTTKSNLGQHAKIHLAVKPFICEICSHGFTRAAHYESHVAKHKGLKTHRCDQCGESFARLDNLLRHSARHKHGKIFDCSTCGKGFHRKDKLLEHEKVHSEYKFPCHRCSKTFHTNDALKHHLPLHEDGTKTQCGICLKFITMKSLSKHMSAFHKEAVSSENNNNVNRSRSKKASNEEKTNPCLYCKKAFVSPAKLRLHVAKCHAEERHKTVLEEKTTFESTRNYFDDFGVKERFSSGTSGDSLPSQQVPEVDMAYINSSPDSDLNDMNGGKELIGGITFQPYPTIHIPEEFESKLGANEISTEALQALLFN